MTIPKNSIIFTSTAELEKLNKAPADKLALFAAIYHKARQDIAEALVKEKDNQVILRKKIEIEFHTALIIYTGYRLTLLESQQILTWLESADALVHNLDTLYKEAAQDLKLCIHKLKTFVLSHKCHLLAHYKSNTHLILQSFIDFACEAQRYLNFAEKVVTEDKGTAIKNPLIQDGLFLFINKTTLWNSCIDINQKSVVAYFLSPDRKISKEHTDFISYLQKSFEGTTAMNLDLNEIKAFDSLDFQRELYDAINLYFFEKNETPNDSLQKKFFLLSKMMFYKLQLVRPDTAKLKVAKEWHSAVEHFLQQNALFLHIYDYFLNTVFFSHITPHSELNGRLTTLAEYTEHLRQLSASNPDKKKHLIKILLNLIKSKKNMGSSLKTSLEILSSAFNEKTEQPKLIKEIKTYFSKITKSISTITEHDKLECMLCFLLICKKSLELNDAEITALVKENLPHLILKHLLLKDISEAPEMSVDDAMKAFEDSPKSSRKKLAPPKTAAKKKSAKKSITVPPKVNASAMRFFESRVETCKAAEAQTFQEIEIPVISSSSATVMVVPPEVSSRRGKIVLTLSHYLAAAQTRLPELFHETSQSDHALLKEIMALFNQRAHGGNNYEYAFTPFGSFVIDSKNATDIDGLVNCSLKNAERLLMPHKENFGIQDMRVIPGEHPRLLITFKDTALRNIDISSLQDNPQSGEDYFTALEKKARSVDYYLSSLISISLGDKKFILDFNFAIPLLKAHPNTLFLLPRMHELEKSSDIIHSLFRGIKYLGRYGLTASKELLTWINKHKKLLHDPKAIHCFVKLLFINAFDSLITMNELGLLSEISEPLASRLTKDDAFRKLSIMFDFYIAHRCRLMSVNNYEAAFTFVLAAFFQNVELPKHLDSTQKLSILTCQKNCFWQPPPSIEKNGKNNAPHPKSNSDLFIPPPTSYYYQH